MATWKKIIVSGSNAELNQLNVGANQQISSSAADTFLSGSFSGSFYGDGSGLTGVSATAILGVTGSDNTSGSVNLATQGLTITGTSNEIETTISGQTLTIGLPNDVTIGNNLTVTGDLTVNGTTTTINTQNLLVEDKFVLLASGSTTNTDGGIIVQNNSAGSGFAYFLDDVTTPRWGFTSSLAHGASSATADEYAVSAKSTGSIWTAASPAPTYGGSAQGYGNIVIDNNGDIWMYA